SVALLVPWSWCNCLGRDMSTICAPRNLLHKSDAQRLEYSFVAQSHSRGLAQDESELACHCSGRTNAALAGGHHASQYWRRRHDASAASRWPNFAVKPVSSDSTHDYCPSVSAQASSVGRLRQQL